MTVSSLEKSLHVASAHMPWIRRITTNSLRRRCFRQLVSHEQRNGLLTKPTSNPLQFALLWNLLLNSQIIKDKKFILVM